MGGRRDRKERERRHIARPAARGSMALFRYRIQGDQRNHHGNRAGDSPLLFLGYFAILESLLTHQPKPADTIDSITRQVKRKIILLDNRWQPRIDYSPFPKSAPERIWSVMYSYRSCLAHGGDPDFKKELHLLVDGNSALRLLRQTVKAVLRPTLVEPQLILDLRNC